MNENNSPEQMEAQDDEISLLDLLQVLVDNARLLIFGPLLIGLSALGISFTITPTYTAVTSIMTPQQQQSGVAAGLSQLGALAGAAGAAAGIKNPTDLYVGLLKSRTIADQMVNRFKLMDVYETEFKEDARKSLDSATNASAGKDGLITIAVDDKDPKRAAALANAYVQELSALTGKLAVTEAQQRRKFLAQELAKAKQNLVRTEAALGRTGVGESFLKMNPQAIGEGIATIKAQVMAKEVQLSSMRGYLTSESPDFRQAQQELSALRAQLNKAEQNTTTGDNTDYINRYRDFKYSEVLYEQIAKQYELARIDESRDGAVIQVVDLAEPPERKSKPKKALIAILATLAAFFVLVLFTFIRESLKKAGQDPESAAKLENLRGAFLRIFRK